MKLQARYNRITIITTIFILLIAAGSYYFLVRYVLISQLDEALKVEEAELHDYIKKYDKLPAPTVYKDQRISYKQVKKPAKRSFKSLEIFYDDENTKELSRQLLFPVAIQGENYMVSVTKSEESTQDLVWIILFSTIGLVALLSVILFFTNRFLIKKLWQPFQNTLSTIKEFNLSAPVDISMQPTAINEFRELNESIRMMAQKMIRDYQSLKDFTDHASHELQTPLAIMISQLDVLIQEPELSEKSMQQVQNIYRSVEKLSRLCHSLLLLTRIENNQYSETEQIAVHELVRERCNEFEEWLDARHLKISMKLRSLTVTMNRELADILISNLLRNAINHNYNNGSISITTGDHTISVCNTGLTALNERRVFDRFYKSDLSEGSGLGLAILQKICDQYKFVTKYSFDQGQHCFVVDFQPH